MRVGTSSAIALARCCVIRPINDPRVEHGETHLCSFPRLAFRINSDLAVFEEADTAALGPVLKSPHVDRNAGLRAERISVDRPVSHVSDRRVQRSLRQPRCKSLRQHDGTANRNFQPPHN